MSHKAVTWAFRQEGLTPVEKLVLVYLADAERDGTCHPGRERIAAACGVNLASVSKALKRFQDMGLISIEKEWKRNRYRVHFDAFSGGDRQHDKAFSGGVRQHENGYQVASGNVQGCVRQPDKTVSGGERQHENGYQVARGNLTIENRKDDDDDDDEGARAISEKFVELWEQHWPSRAPYLSPRMTLETEARQFLDAGGTVKLAVEHLEAQMPRVAARGRSPPRSLKFFRDSLSDELAKQRETVTFQSKPNGAETPEQRRQRIIEMARNGD